MNRVKLCLGLLEQVDMPPEAQVRLFGQVGFDGFFAGWERGADLLSLRAAADATGMEFQSVHAPFGLMADMWRPTDRTETAVGELTDCLRDCAAAGVPLLIMHGIIGFDEHTPTQFGLDNFSRVVAEAKRLGVRIAFENVEGDEYLEALMTHFAGEEHVGFCWDSGHEMCYSHGKDMLALYGDRLMGIHLNDNLGIRDFAGNITWLDDLHLLPFDGIADWRDITARLRRCGFFGPLTFELVVASKPGRHENDAYGRMDITEYITQAYMRACRVGALLLRDSDAE